jgi:UDP-N-acetylglucosamine 2-epimerase (non-hydrolysing)
VPAKIHVAATVGTRPEAIKMAPVIKTLAADPEHFAVTVLSTGQHREMLAQALSLFSIVPDVDLRLMTPDQGLAGLTQGALGGLTQCLSQLRPDMLLVQGDTTTVFAASLAAFYLGVPVGHVEAGLRSHDMANPFPEEANRRLTSVLTALHFAPTPLARRELLREGHDPASVVVTGNTVVDALLGLTASLGPDRCPLLDRLAPDGGRAVLVTSHRRESWGEALTHICAAVGDLADAFPDVAFLYPVHLNPRVREVAFGVLGGRANVHLLDPLDYATFVLLMRDATLILTDSGGVQEEAPTFHTPVLVLRKVTERPEASRLGLARLVGSDRRTIVAEASRLLADEDARQAMRQGGNPYGDGRAAGRIALAIKRHAAGLAPLLPTDQQFGNEEATDA